MLWNAGPLLTDPPHRPLGSGSHLLKLPPHGPLESGSHLLSSYSMGVTLLIPSSRASLRERGVKSHVVRARQYVSENAVSTAATVAWPDSEVGDMGSSVGGQSGTAKRRRPQPSPITVYEGSEPTPPPRPMTRIERAIDKTF